MKPLLIAAGLLLIPAAAQAQIAAATMPNSFDAPASASRAAVIPAVPMPVNPRAEDVLRQFAGAQEGTIDYALMTDDLAGKVREQEATIRPLITGFGPILAVDFVGSQNGADLFAVTFTNAATQWVIGFNDADKVAALLFRPAE